MIKYTKRFVGEGNSQKLFIASEHSYIGMKCCPEGLIFKAFEKPQGDWLCRPVDASSRILIPRIAVENYDLNGYVDTIVDTDAGTVVIKRDGKPFTITDYTKVSAPCISTKEMKNVPVRKALDAVSCLQRATKHKSFKISYCNTKDQTYMKVERIECSEAKKLISFSELLDRYGNSLVYFNGYVEFTSPIFKKLFIKNDMESVAMSVEEDCIIISPEITKCDLNKKHIIKPAKQKSKTEILCSDCAKAESEIGDGITEIEKLLEKVDRLVRMTEALKRENGILKEQISVLSAK